MAQREKDKGMGVKMREDGSQTQMQKERRADKNREEKTSDHEYRKEMGKDNET